MSIWNKGSVSDLGSFFASIANSYLDIRKIFHSLSYPQEFGNIELAYAGTDNVDD